MKNVKLVYLALLFSLGSLAAQDVSQYMQPEPFGVGMESPSQKATRRRGYEIAAMAQIERLGLYAAVTREGGRVVTIADGSATWVPEVGEVFPFLGFAGGVGRVKLGNTWIPIEKDLLTIFKLAEYPQAAAKHQQLLTEHYATMNAKAREDELYHRQEQNDVAMLRLQRQQQQAQKEAMEMEQRLKRQQFEMELQRQEMEQRMRRDRFNGQ